MFNSCDEPCQLAQLVLKSFGFEMIGAETQMRNLFAILYGDLGLIGLPEIHVHKINPTKFLYSIKNAKGSFYIQLKEGYSPDWKAYLIPQHGVEGAESPIHSSGVDHPLITFGADEFMMKLGREECGGENCRTDFEWVLSGEMNRSLVSRLIRAILGTDGIVQWPESFHWNESGLHNVWFLDLSYLEDLNEKTDPLYKKNPDGTYDLHVLVEYSYQKFSYLGLVSTVATFVFIGIYFILEMRTTRSSQKTVP